MLISQKAKRVWELRCDSCQKVFEKIAPPSKIERAKEHSCSKECHLVVMRRNTYRGGKVKYDRTKNSSIHVGDGTVKVPLSQGLYAIVTEEDWHIVKDYTWSASAHLHTYYATASDRDKDGKKKRLYMHKLLLDAKVVDHKDRNGLNNVRSNLRESNMAENSRNSKIRSTNISGVTGVTWVEATKKWRANITINGKTHYLGNFLTKEEAIEARKKAEVEIDAELYGHNQ